MTNVMGGIEKNDQPLMDKTPVTPAPEDIKAIASNKILPASTEATADSEETDGVSSSGADVEENAQDVNIYNHQTMTNVIVDSEGNDPTLTDVTPVPEDIKDTVSIKILPASTEASADSEETDGVSLSEADVEEHAQDVNIYNHQIMTNVMIDTEGNDPPLMVKTPVPEDIKAIASNKILPASTEATAGSEETDGVSLSEADVEENAQDVKENAPELSSKTPKDFLLLEEIGEGSYSTVHIGCERKTSRKFAIKICSKLQIIREKKTTQIFREKECLTKLSTNENFHPFIVRLYCTFQDKESLYFVMSLASRKDLLQVLKKKKKFSLDEARFVAAEIVVALDHIHKFNIVHRDVKPENILLSDTGHMVLSDFGCAKFLEQTEAEKKELETRIRKSSFVGTAHYVCPEVLLNKPIDETCDYWALGCTIFQLLAGDRPFNDVSEYFIFKRITALRYSFPDDFPSDDAKDLIQQFLQIESADRLGSNKKGGAEALKAHPFFSGIEDWEKLPELTSPLIG